MSSPHPTRRRTHSAPALSGLALYTPSSPPSTAFHCGALALFFFRRCIAPEVGFVLIKYRDESNPRRVVLRGRVGRPADLLRLAIIRRFAGRRVADDVDGAGAVPRRDADATGETRRVAPSSRKRWLWTTSQMPHTTPLVPACRSFRALRDPYHPRRNTGQI